MLLVPFLEETESGPTESDPEPADESPLPPAMSRAAPQAPPSEPAAPSRAGRGSGRPIVRVPGFLALLVVLALAGLLFGRLVRNVGDDGTPKPATSAASTTTRAAPAPRGERWGPLKATPAGRLASPAGRAAAALFANRVVVLGGTAGNAVQLGTPGGVMRRVGSLPSERASAAAFATKGAVYLIGGERGVETPSDEILRFDLASHRVTPAGRFIEPLAGAGYVSSGGSLLLVGGWTGEKYATAVLRFTLPDNAALVARLPEALRDPAVVLHGGRLYVAGGRGDAGPSDTVYVVDLASGTVSVLGRLPRAVAGASLVAVGGQLYVLGGKDKRGPVASVVRIDPASGRIEPAGRMPRPLAGAVTAQVGRATLVIGGTRPTAVHRIEPS